GYAAEFMGAGREGLEEVAARVEAAGAGAAAIVFGAGRNGSGHIWNLVNVPGTGLVWVDAQRSVWAPGEQPLYPDATRIWAIPLDADNTYIPGTGHWNDATTTDTHTHNATDNTSTAQPPATYTGTALRQSDSTLINAPDDRSFQQPTGESSIQGPAGVVASPAELTGPNGPAVLQALLGTAPDTHGVTEFLRTLNTELAGGQQRAEAAAQLAARRVSMTAGESESADLEGFGIQEVRLLQQSDRLAEVYRFEVALAELESSVPGKPMPTPSGLFVPAKGLAGFVDDGRAQLQAAFGFPKVKNALVVHVHTDGAGRFVVGNRALGAAEFYREVIAPKALADGRLLVFVGCDVNSVVAGGRPAAEVIRELAPGLHLVSADAPVFTMPNGSVLTLRYTFDGNGLPTPGNSLPGGFTLMPAGGGEPVGLGPDLLVAVREQIPALLSGDWFEVSPYRAVPAVESLVQWMPRKKATGGPQPVATGSAVRDEDIWVSFGDPEQFREHIQTFGLKVTTNPFSGVPMARLSGGHQLGEDGKIQIRDGGSLSRVGLVAGSQLAPLPNGVFDAMVEYRPLVGDPVAKLSAFFPTHLSWDQIRSSAAQAYRNAVRAGEANFAGGFNSAQAGVDSLLKRFVGTDVHGNWLAGFVVAGEIKSVFPLYREPGPALTTEPNPWVRTTAVQAPAETMPAASAVEVAEAGETVQPAGGVMLSEIVWQPKRADQVSARAGQLWDVGRQAVAAGSLSFGKLLSEVADALARARRLAKGQQGLLVESLLTLEAVVSADRLTAAGGRLGVAEVGAALAALRAAITAQQQAGADFQGHADDVVRALAGLQGLSTDWAGAEAWPVGFSRWLAVLHSGMMVARQKASVARSVYDQHLQVLSTSGIALLETGELSAEGLSAELGRLSLKSRHETEQRMWLSDIRYAIGSAGASTAVAAVRERLDFLTAEQKRLNEVQGQNGAQRQSAPGDDRNTVWAGETGERIARVRQDIEQLSGRFTVPTAQLSKLRAMGDAVALGRQVWQARDLGYLPYKEAVAFANTALELADEIQSAPGRFAVVSKDGSDAVRAVTSLVNHPDDPEREIFDSSWQSVANKFLVAELKLLMVQSGPHSVYARKSLAVYEHNRVAEFTRRDISGAEKYFAGAEDVRQTATANSQDPAMRVTHAVNDGGEGDIRWAIAETALTGATSEQVIDRLGQLTGDLARERVVTGVTPPYRLMLMITQIGQMRHLTVDPSAFAAKVRDKALRLVREVQAELLKPSFAHAVMVNAISDDPSDRVSARLETVASAWVELVRFGFADVAVVRGEVARTGVFGRLADAFRLPELGEHVQRLFELHLRVVAGPQRVSEGKKWRDSILDGIGQVVRGRKGKHPGDVAPPARYAGVVLDALVEAAGRQVPAPRADFEDEVRGVRAALQKLSAEWSYPVDLVVQGPARVLREPVPLSDEALAEVSGAVDRLAAMVPLVFDGALDLADYTTAAHQVARLVARQADLGLVLRAVVLALLGDRPLDPVPLQRTMEALLAFRYGGSDPGVDSVALLEDFSGIVTAALKNTTLLPQRFDMGIALARSDQEWHGTGFGTMSQEQIAALIDGGHKVEVLRALVNRVGAIADYGSRAASGGLLTPELFWKRLSELPDMNDVFSATDRAQFIGFGQLAEVQYRLEAAGNRPLPDQVFAQTVYELGKMVVLPTAEPTPAAQAGVEDHRSIVQRILARLRLNTEYGGVELLPRQVALMALHEAIAYRSARLDKDYKEAARRFGRWLGLLEHAGFDAYRIAPDVIRWSFVRLLDAKVPTGFEERVGLLAARLASPDTPIAELRPLDVKARDGLRATLAPADELLPAKTSLQSDGVEIGVGVVEVVERLAARRVPSVVSGTGPSVGLEDFR
ncbi:toxin glutamine deamidase domain-containing protein, partial [Kitasatospora sp. NE20-6]|uniref:toxin glutamine deamidase domain-containing protein n=1 Tax=Kitasatospora sp. NE20-6 TaxID=2859066 RepID=UPI0038B3F45A